MLSFLAGCQSGTVIGALLVASVVLALLTFVIIVLLGAAITSAGSKDGAGCCSLPCIGLVLVVVGLYNAGENIVDMVKKDKFTDMVLSMHNADADEFGVISVFRKERVRLYQYYTELKQRRRQCDDYIGELKAERKELNYEQARNALTNEIQKVEKEAQSIDAILGSIEDLAGRIYFSRLMKNLGVNTDTRELDGEMDSVQQQSEHAIMKHIKLSK